MNISFDGDLTILDGKKYNRTDLAKHLGLVPNTIYTSYRIHEDSEERELWIRKKIWLKSQGFEMFTTVYLRDGFFITAHQIAKATHLSLDWAFTRGKKFEAGEITKVQLLKTAAAHYATKTKQGKANWKGLKGKGSERMKVSDIPTPTKYEYEAEMQYDGQCLPGMANSGGRRY